MNKIVVRRGGGGVLERKGRPKRKKKKKTVESQTFKSNLRVAFTLEERRVVDWE